LIEDAVAIATEPLGADGPPDVNGLVAEADEDLKPYHTAPPIGRSLTLHPREKAKKSVEVTLIGCAHTPILTRDSD